MEKNKAVNVWSCDFKEDNYELRRSYHLAPRSFGLEESLQVAGAAEDALVSLGNDELEQEAVFDRITPDLKRLDNKIQKRSTVPFADELRGIKEFLSTHKIDKPIDITRKYYPKGSEPYKGREGIFLHAFLGDSFYDFGAFAGTKRVLRRLGGLKDPYFQGPGYGVVLRFFEFNGGPKSVEDFSLRTYDFFGKYLAKLKDLRQDPALYLNFLDKDLHKVDL